MSNSAYPIPIPPYTNLVDQMLKGWRVRVDGAVVVEIGVQSKVGERLPGRLIGSYLEAVQIKRRVVPHRGAGHHGDALHRSVAHLTAILSRDHHASRLIKSSSKPAACFNIIYLLLLHLQLHLDGLFLIFAALVLEPHSDYPRR